MDLPPEMVKEFAEAVKGLKMTVDEVEKLTKPGTSIADNTAPVAQAGNSSVYIQAGGVLVIVLMMSAMFVLGYCVKNSSSLDSQMAKIEQRQDQQDEYLHAIYMMAPQLKPKESSDERSGK